MDIILQVTGLISHHKEIFLTENVQDSENESICLNSVEF